MSTQFFSKAAILAVALIMNALIFGGVSELFAHEGQQRDTWAAAAVMLPHAARI